MELISFRITNCFGFHDSGEVDLKDPHNLIYVLGRNSSGKSSFLNAIKYFESGIIPKDQPNFKNFNDSGANPRLTAEFTVEESDLSVVSFMESFFEKYKQVGLDKYAIDYNPKLKTLVNTIHAIYQTLIEELIEAKTVRIEKTAEGHYLFSQYHPFEKYYARHKQVGEAIKATYEQDKAINVRGSLTVVDSLSFNEIEDILFLQFPRILLFNEHYSLRDTLPERITSNNVHAGKDSVMLRAFIDYLDREKVEAFLESNDPDERDELRAQLQRRINELTAKVNRHRRGLANKDLLEIRLHEKNGLQITVQTDGKKSYYSNISDNTKFLFAYYLYHTQQNISGDILLFDEPSNGFHPTAQEFILNFLQSLADNQNLVIVSTHSEYLIDTNRLSGVRLMSIDEKKNITVKNHFYNQPKEKGDYLALQPIFDAIGFSFGKQIVIKDKVVITEGVTDMLYLRAFNTILKRKGELNIAPARSDSHILSLIPLLISQGITFKIVIDTGNIKKEIQKSYGISDDFIKEIPVPDAYASSVYISGIEDLFSKEDFKKLLTLIGEPIEAHFNKVPNSIYIKDKGNAKRLLAHHLYSYINDYDETKFETETIENFRTVLDFCKSRKWFAI